MTWYHLLLLGAVAVSTYATLQLTGVDRVAWSNPARRLAYIALAVLGLALALGTALGEDARSTSAMLVGWAIGVGVGSIRASVVARSQRAT